MGKQTRTRSEELRRIRAEAAHKEARTRRIVMLVGGAVVLGLVVAIAFAVYGAARGSDDGGGTASGKVVVPANLDNGSMPVGSKDAPVTIAIYLDYMCPACGQFEAAQGKDLDQMTADGEVRLELRPISFLDRTSQGTKYSTRAANAMATVVDGAPEKVWAFHQALYAEQPQEGSTGLSDDMIAALARDAGVPSDVVAKFTEGTFEPWVAKFTQDAFDSGVEQTPTVLVDGKPFEGDVFAPGAMVKAVEAAARGSS